MGDRHLAHGYNTAFWEVQAEEWQHHSIIKTCLKILKRLETLLSAKTWVQTTILQKTERDRQTDEKKYNFKRNSRLVVWLFFNSWAGEELIVNWCCFPLLACTTNLQIPFLALPLPTAHAASIRNLSVSYRGYSGLPCPHYPSKGNRINPLPSP